MRKYDRGPREPKDVVRSIAKTTGQGDTETVGISIYKSCEDSKENKEIVPALRQNES